MPKGVYLRSEDTKQRLRTLFKGHHFTEESKRKIGDASRGERNYQWNGGSRIYFHEQARSLFGKSHCEKCGVSLGEYQATHKIKKQFEMHCMTKDYSILEEWNWECLCSRCHVHTEDIYSRRNIDWMARSSNGRFMNKEDLQNAISV